MLRARLMLGLMLLLIILLATGLYSIDKCSELGRRIEKFAHRDDATSGALHGMKREAYTMIGAAFQRLSGSGGDAALAAATAAFEKSLETEKARPGQSPDEAALVKKLAGAYSAYRADARALFQAPAPNPAVGAVAGQLGSASGDLLDLSDQLIAAHEATFAADHVAEATDINTTIRLLDFLMLLGLAATVLAYLGLNRGLVNPLRTLTASIRQVGEGNLDQQVPVLDEYELGGLARSFNQMAAQLKVYRAATSEELMRLNLTIRATLASFPDPIFVLNSEGAVEFRNPEADQLAVQLLFSGVMRLPQKVNEKVEHVRRTGQDYIPTLFKEAIKFHLNGQDRYFLPRIVLLRDEKQVAFGVAVILEDVTRMLLLDDVKSNLISTVSHELKTPLTSVRMALYLLVETTVGSLNEKQMDLVVTARADADRLLHTLNDLLDLAKLEQGPAQLALEEMASGALVEASVNAVRETAQTAGVAIRTEVVPGLPPVRVDPQRMQYVFANLITNAVKYADAGEIFVKAEKGRDRAGRPSVRFSVRDQGPGISPEHQEHIFERFYRVPGSNKAGAGLGLSIAREIVVAHGGEIGVISNPGAGPGAEFFFVLPFAAPPDAKRV